MINIGRKNSKLPQCNCAESFLILRLQIHAILPLEVQDLNEGLPDESAKRSFEI